MSELPRDQFPLTRLSLIGRIRSGTDEEQKNALGCFFESYQPALTSYLVKCKQVDPDTANELVQDFVLNKIMTGKVLEYASGKARFRDTLRTCIYRDFISLIRKRKRDIDVYEGQGDSDDEAKVSDDYDALDDAWAVAIMTSALSRMRDESQHWELYFDRVLTYPPMPYEKIVEKQGYQSPTQASNYLVNAKRNFNRIMAECIEEQSILSGEFDSNQLNEEIAFIRKQLANSNRIVEVVDSLRNTAGEYRRAESMFEHSIVREHVLFVDESVDEIWSKQDSGEMLTHLLDQPVQEFVKTLSKESENLAFRNVFAKENVSSASLEDLQKLKEFFNHRSKTRDSDLPERVDVSVTFALIAKYVSVGGVAEKITSMRRNQLIQRLTTLVDREWIDPQIRGVFRDAVTYLLR